jgi:hypothetical protein
MEVFDGSRDDKDGLVLGEPGARGGALALT